MRYLQSSDQRSTYFCEIVYFHFVKTVLAHFPYSAPDPAGVICKIQYSPPWTPPPHSWSLLLSLWCDTRLALATRRGVYVFTLTPDPSRVGSELCLQRAFIENDTEGNSYQIAAALNQASAMFLNEFRSRQGCWSALIFWYNAILFSWLCPFKTVFRIRIQLNPDPAKNINPDSEDLDFGSGSKLFLNTIWKKLKLLHNYKILINRSLVCWRIECCKSH